MCISESNPVRTVDLHADEISARMRAWRCSQGLSQAEVERRAGLAHNAISRIETGEVEPKLATLERIADSMGISIEQLQFRYPRAKAAVTSNGQKMDRATRLMEMVAALPSDRRDQVVDMLIQVVQQVRP